MIRRPPRSTRTDTLFPDTTLFRSYRRIDFKRGKDGVPAKVASIEYDPNRSARIALLNYADGEKRYILQPEGLKLGAKIMSGPDADILVGNALALRNIPAGTIRSEERRVGQEGVSTCRSRWSTDH